MGRSKQTGSYEWSAEIKHRNKLAKVFITFPQSTDVCTKQQLLQHFNNNFKIVKYLIVQEPHAKGGVHLHAIFWFDNDKKPSKAQILDTFKKEFSNDNKRVDVEAVRCEKAAIQYLTDPVKNKEIDLEPMANFELPKPGCQYINRAVSAYKKFLLPEETQDDVDEFEAILISKHGTECAICLEKILLSRKNMINSINKSTYTADVEDFLVV